MHTPNVRNEDMLTDDLDLSLSKKSKLEESNQELDIPKVKKKKTTSKKKSAKEWI